MIAMVGYMAGDQDDGGAGSRRSAPPAPRVGWAERFKALVVVLPVLVVFVVVIVGIYGGWANPTEAAAIGAAACGMLAVVTGGMRWRGLWAVGLGTAQTTAMIFLVLLGADQLNTALALSQMPAELAAWVKGSGFPPLLVMIAILVIYVLLGCVMDSLAMILLTIPVFYPVVMGLDFWGLAPDREVDLVRHPRADGGRDRPGAPAGGHERLHHQPAGQERAADRNLQGRGAVPAVGLRCASRCCCSFPSSRWCWCAPSIPDSDPVPSNEETFAMHIRSVFRLAAAAASRPARSRRPWRSRWCSRCITSCRAHVQRAQEHHQALVRQDRARNRATSSSARSIPSMQLGGTPAQLFDQARDGVADIVWTLPTYSAGRFVKSEVFELPFFTRSGKGSSQAFWEYVQKNAMDEFAGVKPLWLHTNDGSSFHMTSAKGVKTHGGAQGPEDPRRHAARIRACWPRWARPRCRCRCRRCPKSMAKGVIDGAMVPWEGVPAAKLQEIAKSHLDSAAGPAQVRELDLRVRDEPGEVRQPAGRPEEGHRRQQRRGDVGPGPARSSTPWSCPSTSWRPTAATRSSCCRRRRLARWTKATAEIDELVGQGSLGQGRQRRRAAGGCARADQAVRPLTGTADMSQLERIVP